MKNERILQLEDLRWEILQKKIKSPQDHQIIDTYDIELEIILSEEIVDLMSEIRIYYPIYNDIYDLVNCKKDYPLIIDLLLVHAAKDYNPRNLEGIIRSLITKSARGKTSSTMLEILKKNTYEKRSCYKCGISSSTLICLEYTCDKNDIIALSEAVCDPAFSAHRAELVKILKKIT
jgi:hypothetical protein